MKTVCIAIFSILACFTLPVFSATQKKVEGNMKYLNITRKTDDFDRIKIGSSVNVIYHQNPDSAGIIRIYCEENIKDNVRTTVKKGLLTIKVSDVKTDDFGVVILHVYSSYLTEVENNGSGVFETSGKLKGAEVFFSIVGNGQIKAEKLEYNIVNGKLLTGSGDMLLKGDCNTAVLAVTGSGEIRAHDLKSRDAKCTITGNGNIGCYATKKLNTLITGSGNIYYNGNPEVKKRVIGSGRVNSLDGVDIE